MLMVSMSLLNRDSFILTDLVHSRPTEDRSKREVQTKIINRVPHTLAKVVHAKKITKIFYTESST